MIRKLVIIGAGDFGREVAALVRRINLSDSEIKYEILGFVDDSEQLQGKIVDGIPVIGKIELLNEYEEELYAVCSVGVGKTRKKIIEKIMNEKILFPNLIDPTVVFLEDSKMGVGNIICANNAISIATQMDNHVIINLSCTIGHDVKVGSYCTINPGSNLSGFVELEDCVDVGTGTKIIQHVSIGNNTTIGAGTVVVRDIEPNVTVVGSPARVIKYHME